MSILEDFNIKHLLKKHVCPFCNFRTHKNNNHDVNKTKKHGNKNLDQDHGLIQSLSQPQCKNNIIHQVM